jgi:hypothetical protein
VFQGQVGRRQFLRQPGHRLLHCIEKLLKIENKFENNSIRQHVLENNSIEEKKKKVDNTEPSKTHVQVRRRPQFPHGVVQLRQLHFLVTGTLPERALEHADATVPVAEVFFHAS